MTKNEQPVSFRTSDSTTVIIAEILRQNPDLEGNVSAAIRKALYDWREQNAPDLKAPTERDRQIAAAAFEIVRQAGGFTVECEDWLRDGDFDPRDGLAEYVEEWREIGATYIA